MEEKQIRANTQSSEQEEQRQINIYAKRLCVESWLIAVAW